VSYDAPGHGDSRGKAGTILDHKQIIEALEYAHGPFQGVIAHSLGVPFALHAVRGTSARAVATIGGVCEFAFLVESMCVALDLRPEIDLALRRSIEKNLFGGDVNIWRDFSGDVIADATDLLVIHDEFDETVPLRQADLLVTAYGSNARRITTAGLGHQRILTDDSVIDSAVAFLRGHAATGATYDSTSA
jgi:pimeloyl-ACP methyl ester carboxylesterase